MRIDYKPLWVSLLDLDRQPTDMVKEGIISSATLAKMRKNGGVNIETLAKICAAYRLPIEKVVRIHID